MIEPEKNLNMFMNRIRRESAAIVELSWFYV